MELGLGIGLVVAVIAAIAAYLLGLAKGDRRVSESQVEVARLTELARQTDSIRAELESARNLQREAEANVQRLTADVRVHETAIAAERTRSAEALAAKDEQTERLIQESHAAHRREMDALRESLADQRRILDEAQVTLKDAFQALSAETIEAAQAKLQQHAEERLALAKRLQEEEHRGRTDSIRQMVKPIEDELKRLEEQRQRQDRDLAETTGQLSERLTTLMSATSSLTQALKRPQVRGSWGEGLLRTVLTNSGLQEGLDYDLQVSTDTDSGRLRPDAVINLPRGRKIIIDAKNLFDPYQDYIAATDDQTRDGALSRFKSSVRTQIQQLSTKAYQDQVEGADFVIMFLPHEGMYHAAVEHDSELYQVALRSKVFIANPMTLVSMLRTVSYILDQERLNKSAHEIAEIGRNLYKGMKSYAEHVANVGRNLNKSVDAYNKSVGSLESQIYRRAIMLESKGAKLGDAPTMPAEITERARAFKNVELGGSAAELPADVLFDADGPASEDTDD